METADCNVINISSQWQQSCHLAFLNPESQTREINKYRSEHRKLQKVQLWQIIHKVRHIYCIPPTLMLTQLMKGKTTYIEIAQTLFSRLENV
jgi:hypothetical protein